jgi:hypothetical protein
VSCRLLWLALLDDVPLEEERLPALDRRPCPDDEDVHDPSDCHTSTTTQSRGSLSMTMLDQVLRKGW